MAVNFGVYSGWKDLSDKTEKGVNRLIDAYKSKIQKDEADEEKARLEAVEDSRVLTDQTVDIYRADNVDTIKADHKKSYNPFSWANKDKNIWEAAGTGSYTQDYIRRKEDSTGFVDTNNDGIWGNEGDEKTLKQKNYEEDKRVETERYNTTQGRLDKAEDRTERMDQLNQFGFIDEDGDGQYTEGEEATESFLSRHMDKQKTLNYENISKDITTDINEALKTGDITKIDSFLTEDGISKLIKEKGYKDLTAEEINQLQTQISSQSVNMMKRIEKNWIHKNKGELAQMPENIQEQYRNAYYLVEGKPLKNVTGFLSQKQDDAATYDDAYGNTKDDIALSLIHI